MADKIVVLRAGVIEQVGAPLELYRNPDNKFVAGFIGSPAMNFVAGKTGKGAVSASGLGGGEIPTGVAVSGPGADVTVGVRPQHLRIDRAGKTHKVEMTEALGGVSFIHLTSATGEKLIIEAHDEDEVLKRGAEVGISFAPEHVMLFDAATDKRLR